MKIKLPEVQGDGGGEYELSGGSERLNLLNKQLVVEILEGQRLQTYNVFVKQGGKIRLRCMQNNDTKVPPVLLYKWIAAILLLPKPKKVKLDSPNDYRIKTIEFDIITVASCEIVIKLNTVEISTLSGSKISDIAQRMQYVLSLQDRLKNGADYNQSNDFNSYYKALSSSNIYGINGVIQATRAFL